jgi:hypothetical protein
VLKDIGKRYNGFVAETPEAMSVTDFVAPLSHTTYRYIVLVQGYMETETTGYEIRKKRMKSCQLCVGKELFQMLLECHSSTQLLDSKQLDPKGLSSICLVPELLKARPTSPN